MSNKHRHTHTFIILSSTYINFPYTEAVVRVHRLVEGNAWLTRPCARYLTDFIATFTYEKSEISEHGYLLLTCTVYIKNSNIFY